MKNKLLVFAIIAFIVGINVNCIGQSIATFNSVEPVAQTQNLVIPSSHTFQKIIRSGMPLSGGGTFGNKPDYTGYVPIDGSSTNGYLSISQESVPAECSILSMSFNSTNKLWTTTSSGNVSLPLADLGYCAAFCSGAITARNTVLVCEELMPNGDSNGDGYDDLGWIIEIDPKTRTVINQDGVGGADKLWAMGRQVHENVTLKKDQSIAYWGGDDIDRGFIYKFIPTVPGNFSNGTLWVLESSDALGNGSWKQVANDTKAERNNTAIASVAAGAYNFKRVEDVEVGPDGKIYFASTTTGRIYRFNDAGSTVTNLEVFVESTTYDIDGPGLFAPVKFEFPDNIEFDGEGNLWILQDGGENHIWVVSPSHTSVTPAIRVFGNTPLGSESTGITFSPDFKFIFISLQHPNASNTAGQTDAAGDNVIFDAPITLVIARKENLGSSVLSDRFINLMLTEKPNGIQINWAATDINDHTSYDIERSADGINFSRIGSMPSSFSTKATYTYFDNNLPIASHVYYRLKQCKIAGQCLYSETKFVKVVGQKFLKIYPLSGGNVFRVMYSANENTDALLQLYRNNGSEVYREKRKVNQGLNEFNITIDNLPNGFYVLKVIEGDKIQSRSFVK